MGKIKSPWLKVTGLSAICTRCGGSLPGPEPGVGVPLATWVRKMRDFERVHERCGAPANKAAWVAGG